MKKLLFTLAVAAIATAAFGQQIGHTTITRWPDGKRGAVSITYDDGSRNQFAIGVPIMDELGLPGTFYINTGRIPGGSKWTGRHTGRSWKEIAAEARTVPTDAANVYERASAMRFAPFRRAGGIFTSAGIEIDAGRMAEGIAMVDDFYRRLNAGELERVPQSGDDRRGGLPRSDRNVAGQGETERTLQPSELTWDLARELTARGHEFSSHMTTHPYMSALDTPNMLYELESSRDEIRRQLGVRSTLVGEMPYDTEVRRAFETALTVYPVARSRPWWRHTMELHQPGWGAMPDSEKEYVQMRQTVYTRTTLDELNGWVDTAAAGDNIWLVTIHHGIDGIGWEAQPSENIAAHFRHIAASRDKLWVATFGDAARYVKERLSAVVGSEVCAKCGKVTVSVDHPLDKTLFDVPLTLKTYIDPAWSAVTVTQGERSFTAAAQRDAGGVFVLYPAVPGDEPVVLRGDL